jgi:hypothetical protein
MAQTTSRVTLSNTDQTIFTATTNGTKFYWWNVSDDITMLSQYRSGALIQSGALTTEGGSGSFTLQSGDTVNGITPGSYVFIDYITVV